MYLSIAGQCSVLHISTAHVCPSVFCLSSKSRDIDNTFCVARKKEENTVSSYSTLNRNERIHCTPNSHSHRCALFPIENAGFRVLESIFVRQCEILYKTANGYFRSENARAFARFRKTLEFLHRQTYVAVTIVPPLTFSTKRYESHSLPIPFAVQTAIFCCLYAVPPDRISFNFFCEWCPGAQTLLAAPCGLAIKIIGCTQHNFTARSFKP